MVSRGVFESYHVSGIQVCYARPEPSFWMVYGVGVLPRREKPLPLISPGRLLYCVLVFKALQHLRCPV